MPDWGLAEIVDFCIVGAGPAGCVLANRLSENGRHRVLLLEAGPSDWHPYIHIPAASMMLYNDRRFNWLDRSQPEPGLDGRIINVHQGKVLGGSSSINGMLHVRGQREDFVGWTGWGIDELLPYFARSEAYLGNAGETGRGRDGPLAVSDFSDVHALTNAFLGAASEQGSTINADSNGPLREGASLYQQNRRGRWRSQAAQTYLRQARRRPNLEVRTQAACTGVLFEGNRAVGVTYRRGDETRQVRARREVILSAGAIRTPQILQLSGIGDPVHLGQLGVNVVKALPGVGRNLRDHLVVRVAQRLQGIATLNQQKRGPRMAWELIRYVLSGKGLLTMGAATALDVFRSRPESTRPDGLLLFAPGSFAAGSYEKGVVLENLPGMTIGCWASHPESQGSVLAHSRDSQTAPTIRFNYLDAESDRAVTIAAVRRARAIFAGKAFARWSVAETKPGPAIQSDDEILAYARAQGACGYHLGGTCSLGDGPQSVVEASLKVRGIGGLRVVDASIMPNLTVANPHATIVAIAERAADLIAGETP